jgi:hypothetical protein
MSWHWFELGRCARLEAFWMLAAGAFMRLPAGDTALADEQIQSWARVRLESEWYQPAPAPSEPVCGPARF